MKKLYSLAALLCAVTLSSATIRNVPGTYSTIQAALNACGAGDTVLVQPGTYTQALTWPNVSAIRLLSAGDSSNTIIDGGGTAVAITISSSLADTNTIIRGFRITNGYSNTTWSAAGGISCTTGGVKVVACCINGNLPGGSNTTWSYGGGAQFDGGTFVLDGVTIRNNSSTSTGYGYGGGLYVGSGVTAYIRNSEIKDNTVTATNYCFGGGIYNDGTLNITNSSISGNTMSSGGYHFGGGICFRSGTGTLTNVSVTGNTLQGNANYFWGGGIYAESGTGVTLTNVLVADNVLAGSGFVYAGAGIYVSDANTSLTGMHVTLANNRRSNNSAMNGPGVAAESSSSITLTNSILYNIGGTTEVYNSSGTVTITYSDVRNGYTGTGNINAVPGFVSSSDYHLTPTSPCAGVGTTSGAPNFDLDNAVRPQPVASNHDMGCYEVDQLVSTSELGTDFSLKVFPNPFNDQGAIFFILEEAGDMYLDILDVNGQLVKQVAQGTYAAGAWTIPFSASGLAKGLYFAKLETSAEVSVLKMIKY